MFLVATILVAILAAPSLGQVCPYRECACAGTLIDCSNRGLTAVPTRINTGTIYTSLSLLGNSIRTINASSLFPTRLDTLDLSGNPISSITPDSLYGISQTLKSIKFRNSNFAALPPALEILDSLEILDIEGDPMTYPDATVTKLSGTVQQLRLASAGLTAWPTWLSRFTFLRKLYLEGNPRLMNPPTDAFQTWSQSLTHLSLSNTGADSLDGVSALEKLQWLDVSRNSLRNTVSISYDLIPFANTLQFLDVSNNVLTTEPRLGDLRALTEVHLSFNNITTVTLGAFAPSVVALYLDHNLFPSIPTFLSDLPQLQFLSLEHNEIMSVEYNDFPVNSKLTNLYLGENPLSKIDERAFQNFRTTLMYLNLENTWLTRLPLAVTTLTKLQSLWMPNNERLMCSCEEKSVAPWISSLHSLRVVGQCGYVDITEFVAMLAAHCP
jgi:Leucine-rich repeat (LRR) protein